MDTVRKIIALLILVVLAYGAYKLSQRPATVPDAPVVVPSAPSESPAPTSQAPAISPSAPTSAETPSAVATPSQEAVGEAPARTPQVDQQKKKELLKKQSVFK